MKDIFLRVVGLGPGDAFLLTPQARAALEEAEVLAGYSTYMEMVPAELKEGKICFSTGMMGEVERCRQAVDAALEGKRTALVCSGDPGVYALAGLVLELLEARGLAERPAVEIVPGIPALCAAAALLGAPLTHDFACVSLSDLLTPWELIRKRLEAALGADFVLGIYNPCSRRRTAPLEEALRLALSLRGPETPVGLVRQAFRPDQSVRVMNLADLNPAGVDMLSLLIIGNSSTRIIEAGQGRRMLTPRGYAGKYRLN